MCRAVYIPIAPFLPPGTCGSGPFWNRSSFLVVSSLQFISLIPSSSLLTCILWVIKVNAMPRQSHPHHECTRLFPTLMLLTLLPVHVPYLFCWKKRLNNAFFVTFSHITDFYRPAEAIMSLEVVIHLNCSSWWYSASKEYDRGETEPAKLSHQLTIGKGCLCQVPVPCSYHVWILLFFFFCSHWYRLYRQGCLTVQNSDTLSRTE